MVIFRCFENCLLQRWTERIYLFFLIKNLLFNLSSNLFDKEKGTVRTERTNSLFGAIPSLVKVLTEKKKGNLDEDYLNSNLVTFSSQSMNLLLDDVEKISSF